VQLCFKFSAGVLVISTVDMRFQGAVFTVECTVEWQGGEDVEGIGNDDDDDDDNDVGDDVRALVTGLSPPEVRGSSSHIATVRQSPVAIIQTTFHVIVSPMTESFFN
jgi:hypothetical protein